MKHIQLKTLQQFKEVTKQYNSKWQNKLHMWSLFREETCYLPDEDCFISLDKL